MKINPLSMNIGAEITGVDITKPLSSDLIREIESALLSWKVLFFRDQSLNHQQHIEFGRQFGELTPAHVVFGGDAIYPEIYSVAKHRKANARRDSAPLRPWSGWHTDITAAINPPAASILRAEVIPPYGGDTQWTNLAKAYEALSPVMREFIDNLRGVHSFDAPAGSALTGDYDKVVDGKNFVSAHPLVRVHPLTGERVLYVSPSFLKQIVDLSPQESLHIIQMLWEHMILPEFTVRFKWSPGAVAFWDNRSTAHLAPRDIFQNEHDRQLYRVTLAGDVPIGVDGQRSTSIVGEPIDSFAAG